MGMSRHGMWWHIRYVKEANNPNFRWEENWRQYGMNNLPGNGLLIRAITSRYMRLHGFETVEDYNRIAWVACKRISGNPTLTFRSVEIGNGVASSQFGIFPHTKLRIKKGRNAFAEHRYPPWEVKARLDRLCEAREKRLNRCCALCESEKNVAYRRIERIPVRTDSRLVNAGIGGRSANICISCWNKWRAVVRRGNEAAQIHLATLNLKRVINNVGT